MLILINMYSSVQLLHVYCNSLAVQLLHVHCRRKALQLQHVH